MTIAHLVALAFAALLFGMTAFILCYNVRAAFVQSSRIAKLRYEQDRYRYALAALRIRVSRLEAAGEQNAYETPAAATPLSE